MKPPAVSHQEFLGRLKESTEYRGDNGNLTYKQKFDFDRSGNLYRKAANNPTAGQQNPIAYTPIEDADISKTTNRFTSNTTYDDAGQVINDAKFRSMSFAYDANGRQIKATRANVPDAWTVYDAAGNRVATKVNNIWRYVVYDAMGKLVAEYGEKADGPGGVKYVQQDWQGSVRTVTNSNGFAIARIDHQAFGGEVGYGVGQRNIDQGYNRDPATRQGYGLTERDDATGLDHTWFRKNENSAGRWTSPDPYNGSMNLGDPQSFNRYSYVENQPTNFVDPSGLNEESPIRIHTWTWRERYDSGHCYTLYIDGIESGTVGNCGGGGGVDGGGGGGGQIGTPPPDANACAGMPSDWCNLSCLKKEEQDCNSRAENYFNSNAPWNLIKDVFGLPGNLVALRSLRGMTLEKMVRIVTSSRLRLWSLRRLARDIFSKASAYAAVLNSVYSLYDTTQQAVAIENECRRKIPDKCGKACKQFLPEVGRA